jgi:hypothetical protein
MSSMGQSLPKWAIHPCLAFPPIATIQRTCQEVRFVPIVLQKSKVASVQIFAETLNREAIDDSPFLVPPIGHVLPTAVVRPGLCEARTHRLTPTLPR